MGKHAGALDKTEPIAFTVEDSQQLAAIIDPVQRAKQYAEAMHGDSTIETYWAAADAFAAGWAARDELIERGE